jgi:serine protease Do
LLRAMGFDHGVIVDTVKKGGPADKAGIKEQDIITGLNGQPVGQGGEGKDLIARVAETPVGTPITLNLDRDGKKLDIKLVVQDRVVVYSDLPNIAGQSAVPADMPKDVSKPLAPSATSTGPVTFGFYPRVVSEEERELTPDKKGLMVTRVEPGSFAQEIGMTEHDIIIAINRQPVGSLDDVKRIQATLKPGDPVTFRVVRTPQGPGARGRGGAAQAPQTSYLTGTLPEK